MIKQAEWPSWRVEGCLALVPVRRASENYLDEGRPSGNREPLPTASSFATLLGLLVATVAVLAIGIGAGLW